MHPNDQQRYDVQPYAPPALPTVPTPPPPVTWRFRWGWVLVPSIAGVLLLLATSGLGETRWEELLAELGISDHEGITRLVALALVLVGVLTAVCLLRNPPDSE